MFDENQGSANGIVSAVIVIMLFTILAGLVGFYIGDSGKFRGLTNAASSNPNITTYSEEELNKAMSSKSFDFNLYGQIVANLKDKYVDTDKINDQKLFDGSLKGMVDSIGDKATTYFSKEEYKEYQDSFSGKFEGIGVRLEYQNNSVIVMEVIPESPALKENVQVGWIFEKVDGVDVTKSSIEEVVSKVRGTAGTKVKVDFIDPDKKETVTKEITRQAIKVESMRLVEKNKETVVFEVSRFTEDSVQAWTNMWDKNVDEIVSKNYKNVILDLRGNGGGYLDAAVHAANDFLDPGKLILTEKSRVRGDTNTVTKKTNPRLKSKNIVILVNGGTASASEILSGAIRYHNGYKILGTKSYGKGTVQNTYNLPNGGAVKITTEYWLLPTGKRLDTENPILPDTEIKQDQDAFKQGKDNILDEAMKLIEGK
jgi:carboxyl-terminal processing protease